MYEKLKNLSIEELELEIEDLDILIGRLDRERREIDLEILCKQEELKRKENDIVGLRALSKLISDLILEKQKETH